MSKRHKRVSTPQVNRKEVPRRDVLPGAETSDRRLCWRFCHVDHAGPWGFSEIDGTELMAIMNFLSNFESMTINELFHQGGYPGTDYDVASIPNTVALARLVEMGLADMTKIHRLRSGGKPRLYGFLVGNVFHMVWWDPEHEIWPSRLKGT